MLKVHRRTDTNSGFTLIEVIIYLAVLSFMLISMVYIAQVIQSTRTKFTVASVTHGTASRFLNTIDTLVRNADGFVVDASNRKCVFPNKLWLYFATSSVQYLPPGCMGPYTSGAVGIEPYSFSGATTTDNGNANDGYIGHGFAIDSKYIYYTGQKQGDWTLGKRLLADMSYDTGFDGDGRVYETNAATQDPYNIILDGQYLFAMGGGAEGVTGEVMKLRASDGALCTAANCGTAFDTDGVVTPARSTRYNAAGFDSTYLYLAAYEDCFNFRALCQSNGFHTPWWQIAKIRRDTGAYDTSFDSDGHMEPSSGEASDIVIDAANNWMYVAGFQGSSRTVEKRLLSTGAYVTAFGGTGKISNGSGAYLKIKSDGTYLYLAGHNGTDAIIEKRLLTDGSLDTSFGTAGVATSQSSTQYHWGIAVDGDYLYLVGTNSGPDWFYEKRSRTTGSLISSFGSGGFLLDADTNAQEPFGGIAIDEDYMYAAGYYVANGAGNGRVYIEKRSRTSGALAAANGIRLICYQDYPNNGNAATCDNPPPHDDLYVQSMTDPWHIFVGLTDVTFTTTTLGSKQAIETLLNINYLASGLNFAVPTITISSTSAFRINP